MPSVSYNSVSRIIGQAYKNSGIVQDGDDPSSDQIANAMDVLNDMIGIWQTQGIKLWTETDQAVTILAGTATYTFGTGGDVTTRPLKVTMGYYLNSDNIRRPLIALSRQEYTMLSNPTSQGAINSYYFDPQQTLARVTFWLVPDTEAATGTVHLIVRQPITYVSGMLDQINFPQEWYMALHWGLADELSTGQPMSVQQRCQMKAEQYRSMLEDFDVEEASTKFSPSYQGARSSFG